MRHIRRLLQQGISREGIARAQISGNSITLCIVSQPEPVCRDNSLVGHQFGHAMRLAVDRCHVKLSKL